MELKKSANFLKKIISAQESAVFIALIIMCIVTSIFSEAFYSFENLMNILRTTSYVLVIAIANTFIFIMAGLDLSVGSVMGIGGLTVAIFLKMGLPIWLCILLGIIPGIVFGLFNGYAIVKFKIPTMIATLGSLYMARGLCNVITKGQPVFPLPEVFCKIGNGDIYGIPYTVVFVIFLVLLGTYVLNNTTFGRYVYAIGGNVETTRLSGINVGRIQIIVYTLSGIFAALCGIILASRFNSAMTTAGTGWELRVIASIIIGGTSMFGGVGTVAGTVIGALIMVVLENGMILMNISPFWQQFVVGALIVATVGFDQFRRSQKSTET